MKPAWQLLAEHHEWEEGGVDLYLIRHAEAIPLGEEGITEDADRPLTKEGEKQAKAVAAGLLRKGIHLSAVVTSPLLRARQTAEGMVQAWSAAVPQLHTSEELLPGGKRRRLGRFLKQLGSEKVALIGHVPDLGDYAAWLIGSKKAQIRLAKASVACITCDGGPGKGKGMLLWLVTPEWLSA